ncbi:hypothetical protein SKP52_20865 [Sphingopyxis fribergensis]|uniref:TonB-dependent receptor-like beta-barrel domain-containing protein n=1 Tax=Sphingopyxis fribergensis TaxID=1515612 RepID=A0A0A7PSM9_9SPHN|nr:hypothetical protein [Sphingopyxis fribergensis]AJA11037.1 hypothetical protein SKP52_20865 [Sphingopyxis fribergensis]
MSAVFHTSSKIGGTNVTLSLKNEARRQRHWGPEQRFDGNGDLLFVRDEFGRYNAGQPRLSATLAQTTANGYVVDLSLRHDIPRTNLACGGGYFDEHYSPNLRLGAIEKEYADGPFVTAFVEHKNVAGFTMKLSYRNLAAMKDGFNRTVFVDRRDGRVAFSENRSRKFGRFFQLTVTGTL